MLRYRLLLGCAAVSAAALGFLFREQAIDAVLLAETARVAAYANASTDCCPIPAVAGSSLARFLPPLRSRSAMLDAASDVREWAESRHSDTARYADGIACLVSGGARDALLQFERIPPLRRDAPVWTLIAIAHLRENRASDHDAVVGALDASQRALKLTRLGESANVRAVALERMGATAAAVPLWKAYLGDPTTPVQRKAAVGAHLRTDSATETARWAAATRGGYLTDAQWEQLAVALPQQARSYGEGPYLTGWGDAFLKDDQTLAAQNLRRARAIGRQLRVSFGEAMLSDSVAAIDEAVKRQDRGALRTMAGGLVEYRAARIRYSKGETAEAENGFGRAERKLSEGRSPLSAVAAFYGASVAFDENRVADAERTLTRILSQPDLEASGYRGLVARASHEMALCLASRGQWSSSIEAATRAMTLFELIHESGNAAAAEAIVAEDYDFLGQPLLAWRHGTNALRGASAAGDVERARVIVAALSRTELRHERWDAAVALIDVEAMLGRTAPRLSGDCDMLLRRAAAEHHAGRDADAASSISHARVAAAKTSEASVRARLLAGIDGVAGALTRDRDPRAASLLLTSAIEYQKEHDRALLLPQLLLERGRTWLALQRPVDARADFDAGIACLEQQREHVSNQDLRPGVFDDAAELFEAVVALDVEGGEVERALADVERGRGRGLREQVRLWDGAGDAPRFSLRDVRQSIPPGSAVLEYVLLPRAIAVFVIKQDGLKLVLRAAEREVVERNARGLATALAAGTWDDRVQRLSSALFQSLVEPARSDLSGVHHVTIIPDPATEQLPFAALWDEKSRSFFVEQEVISTAPSAALFSWMGRRPSAAHTPQSVVIFANPQPLPPPYSDLPALSAAEDEAQRIASFYPRSNVDTQVTATRESFVSRATGGDVVEFAGHAIVHEDEPWRSALLFGGSSPNSELTSARIASMRFTRGQTVVLAACSTFGGRKGRVEGMSSIGRSFFVAGAGAVIGTLWDVDDHVAEAFTVPLHRRLARGLSAADAVHETQLEALRGSADSRSPVAWAVFSLIGGSPARGRWF